MVALNVTVEATGISGGGNRGKPHLHVLDGEERLTFILFGSVDLMRMEQFASALSCSLNAVNGPFLRRCRKAHFRTKSREGVGDFDGGRVLLDVPRNTDASG